VPEKAETLASEDRVPGEAQQSTQKHAKLQVAHKQTKRLGVSKQSEVATPLRSETQETEQHQVVQHEQKLRVPEQQVSTIVRLNNVEN
jgi:hypothetical protein